MISFVIDLKPYFKSFLDLLMYKSLEYWDFIPDISKPIKVGMMLK